MRGKQVEPERRPLFFVEFEDGRRFTFDESETVQVIGTWDGPSLTARRIPIADLRVGHWVWILGIEKRADRKFDFAVVAGLMPPRPRDKLA